MAKQLLGKEATAALNDVSKAMWQLFSRKIQLTPHFSIIRVERIQVIFPMRKVQQSCEDISAG